jgi:hypothetical protein
MFFLNWIGQSLWTKVISDKTAVDYLFNAEAYYSNFQFEYRLAQPIQVYPVMKIDLTYSSELN